MRVFELAKELRASSREVLTLLRKQGVALRGDKDFVPGDDVSRLRARIERERRQSGVGMREAVQALLEDVQATHVRRRRSRRRIRRAAERSGSAAASAMVGAAVEERSGTTAGPPADSAPPVGGEADGFPVAPEPASGAEVASPEAGGTEARSVAKVRKEAASNGLAAPSDGEGATSPGIAPGAPGGDGPEAAGVRSSDSPHAEGGVGAGSETAVEEPPPSPSRTEAPPQPAVPDPADEGDPAAPRPSPAKPKLRSARSQGPEGPVRVVRKAPRLSPAASAGPGGQVRIQAEGYGPDGTRKRGRKKGKRRQRVDQGAVQENIQRVMAELKGGGRRRRKSREPRPTVEEKEARREKERKKEEREAKTVRVNEFLTVAELGELIDVSSTELIGSAFKSLGLMVTINQRLDFDQIEMLLEEFNFTAVRETEYGAIEEEELEEEEDSEDALLPRPPVVTVMGHVDHGKTKLLDSIRDANVVAGESGGITQHIGAYHVQVDGDRSITFLDTPGHAAFTAMRARGADVTDIVILVVAADDSVMPQTVEAISHARNAGVPLVVAVNKMDLPAADADRVKQQLLNHDVTVEDFGGDVLVAPISARDGTGIEDLLEKVLLQAELLELRANPDRAATGAVIEARLDVGKGPVVSVLVQRGTLSTGDNFVCGKFEGRVRALLDERGAEVREVGPGIPVQILGARGVPQAGDTLQVMESVRASEIAATRQRLEREKLLRIKDRGIRLGDFSQVLAEGEVSTLPLIIKGDVDGSVQAVSDTLQRLGTAEVRVEIVHRAVGAVNEEDVMLARTSGGVIVGFRVRPSVSARQMAEHEDVDIQLYDVIYDAENDVRAALEGMLAPERREKVVASAEVRAIFKVSKVGTIAGCYVSEGVVERDAEARLIRDGIVAYTGKIGSLKRFKDDVGTVRSGLECGIGIANYNDVKAGDVIECFEVEEVARTLAGNARAR